MVKVNTITRVELKDFLVFKGEFTADFCPGVNVLIGGNGSGKTTLMKVLYAKVNGASKTKCQEYFSQTADKTLFDSYDKCKISPSSETLKKKNLREFSYQR
jgi:recombinational DNA repair ATPase RecF